MDIDLGRQTIELSSSSIGHVLVVAELGQLHDPYVGPRVDGRPCSPAKEVSTN